MRELRGSMAVVVYDEQRNVLWLARNEGRPLWLLKRPEGWYFASTRQILEDPKEGLRGDIGLSPADALIPLAAGHVHRLDPCGILQAAT